MRWLKIASDTDLVKDEIDMGGVIIHVEWPAGSTRTWKGSNDTRKMYADYGRIPSTKGFDGDCCDAYCGPNRDSRKVFEVTQISRDTGEFDESKYILGVDNLETAKELYLAHMHPDNLGGIVEISWAEFKRLVDDVLAN